MRIALYHIHDDPWLHGFPADFVDHDWSLVFTPDGLARVLPHSEILLLTNRSCTPELGALLRRGAKQLRWMHFLTAGMDRGIAMGLPPGVRVSYSAGVKAPMVSEHALALLLALIRRIPDLLEDQRRHRWLREEISDRIRTLKGATVCIVGLGNVGRDVARKLKPFGAHVIGVSRLAEAGGEIDQLFPRSRMREALALADAVVVSTMAEEGSAALLDATTLAALKSGAVVVNVARGSLIDEPALIAALLSGRIAGAALDVQAVEPLPPDSPLWDLPNVIVSPHSAGAGASAYAEHRDLFAENLRRFLEGAPLANEYFARL
jgi:phosphoglycerate dehydrogenase-like enzyme